MMAQSFVAASATLNHDLPPSALSAHFIAGGDPEKDLEFHVIALRDERRFANRRVDVMQDGELLTTAMVSYMNGGRGLEHGIEPPHLDGSAVGAARRRPLARIRGRGPAFRQRAAARSTGATPTTRPG